MLGKLADLDELAQKCYTPSARAYINEAIACYEAGAIRSAVVSTWIAIFFDLVDKFRELSIGGDPAATQFVDSYEAALKSSDISRLLRIEREILSSAKDKIQLFGDIEYSNLSRIQEDRNRCAHPTLDSFGDRYNPTSETARAHIVNAVTQLLKYPPTQGKVALNDIITVVESRHFPLATPKATDALRNTGLIHPRPTLLRNAVIVLLKKAVEPSPGVTPARYIAALSSLLTTHRKETISVFQKELSGIVRRATDDQAFNCVRLLGRLKELQAYVDDSTWDKLSSQIIHCDVDDIMWGEDAFDIPRLKSAAQHRVRCLSLNEIRDALVFMLIEPVRHRLLILLKCSNSWSEANDVCAVIEQYISDFAELELNEIKQIAAANPQVDGSFGYKKVVKKLTDKLNSDQSI